jgi:hypothetical protein
LNKLLSKLLRFDDKSLILVNFELQFAPRQLGGDVDISINTLLKKTWIYSINRTWKTDCWMFQSWTFMTLRYFLKNAIKKILVVFCVFTIFSKKLKILYSRDWDIRDSVFHALSIEYTHVDSRDVAGLKRLWIRLLWSMVKRWTRVRNSDYFFCRELFCSKFWAFCIFVWSYPFISHFFAFDSVRLVLSNELSRVKKNG